MTPVSHTGLTHVHREVNPSVEACHMTEETTGRERPEWGAPVFPIAYVSLKQ